MSSHPSEDQAANLPRKGGRMNAEGKTTRGNAHRSGRHSGHQASAGTLPEARRSHGQAAASSAPDDQEASRPSGGHRGLLCVNPGPIGPPHSLVVSAGSKVLEAKTEHARRSPGQEISSIPRFCIRGRSHDRIRQGYKKVPEGCRPDPANPCAHGARDPYLHLSP